MLELRTERRANDRRRLAIAAAIALGVHLLVVALIPSPSIEESPEVMVLTTLVSDEAEDPEPRALEDPPEVRQVRDDGLPTAGPSVTTAIVAVRDTPTREPVVVPLPDPIQEFLEEQQQDEEEPPPQQPREEPDPSMRSVAQPDRDRPPPVDANYLAEVDHSTDEETMAVDTTLLDFADERETAGEPSEVASDDVGAVEPVLAERTSDADTPEPPVESPAASDSAPIATVADSETRSPAAAGAPGDEGVGESDAAVEETAAVDVTTSEANTPPSSEAGSEPVVEESVASEGPRDSALAAFSMSDALQRARSAAEARAGGDGGVVADAAGVHVDAYLSVFGERDVVDSARVSRQERQAALVGDHEARWERTRASLENFDVHVRPGNETSLNTRSDEVAGYIHYLHNRIHQPWWDFLTMSDLSHGAGHPLSDQSLMTVLEYVITREGAVRSVQIVDGSGVLTFDARAVDLLYEIGPHRAPPPGLISSDGNAYVHWTFHRDNRGCGTFGASAHRILSGAGEGG